MKNSFITYYEDESKKLNEYISEFNKKLIITDNTFLKDNLEAFANLNFGGKLIRGTLINLGYSLLKDNRTYSYPLATAFEVFQTSILIHDDIIDKDEKRRGKDTIHSLIDSKYNDSHLGNSVAICMGDYGFYSSMKMISENYKDDDNLSKIISYFSDVVLKTIEGELLDVITPFKEIKKLDNSNLKQDIMDIYKLKTAYYTITGPLSLGLLLGGLEQEKLDSINKFGYNVGVAFQLQDDLLGIYSDSTGKISGSDIKEFKTTMLYAYTKDNKKFYDELLTVYGRDVNDDVLKKTREIFELSGAKGYVEHLIEKFYSEAISIVQNIDWLSDEKRDILIDFVKYLKERKK